MRRSATVAIIDYESGNVHSVAKAFERGGARAIVTRNTKEIKAAGHIVLPGQGHFGQCVRQLAQLGLITVIKGHIKAGKSFFGICLGLQLLFDRSEESAESGLGLITGVVKKFSSPQLKIPHIGWNDVTKLRPSALFDGIADGSDFYFVHSYCAVPADPTLVLTQTTYGTAFCSSIQRENIFACQFHPEKSQGNGLKLIENFLKL